MKGLWKTFWKTKKYYLGNIREKKSRRRDRLAIRNSSCTARAAAARRWDFGWPETQAPESSSRNSGLSCPSPFFDFSCSVATALRTSPQKKIVPSNWTQKIKQFVLKVNFFDANFWTLNWNVTFEFIETMFPITLVKFTSSHNRKVAWS